jgi:hypothetical protein
LVGGVANVRKKEKGRKCGENDARLNPIELLGWRVTDMVCGTVRRREVVVSGRMREQARGRQC